MDNMMEKANAVATIIAKVGVPTFIVVIITVLSAASYSGYIQNPLVTRSQFEEHAANTQALHGTLIGIGKEQVEVLKGIQKEFKMMRCERNNIKMEDQIKCIRDLILEH